MITYIEPIPTHKTYLFMPISCYKVIIHPENSSTEITMEIIFRGNHEK